ncbi:porin family protein [Flavobacterium sp. XGLA_31]|uniref:porin family protein n=1 Tax=Flavobacterium sp. XGLA_31 TaxID=3447666 RepID=UPI003F3B8DA5
MKKIILSLVICSCFTFVKAQTASGKETGSGPEIGIKGGVNFTNLYTDQVDDNNVLTSFNLGLYANLPVTHFISIQPEFNFSRKGSELVYNNAFVSGTSRFKLNYFEVPVLLKINLTPNFNIHFGPYAAYLIDGQATNESSNSSFNFEDNLSNDNYHKLDYGLSAGIGVDFSATHLGLRYNYGLNTVGKEGNFGGTTYTFPDGKNSALSLYLAIKL